MTDTQVDETYGRPVSDGTGLTIHVDDDHVLSMDDVRKVGYDDGENHGGGVYVSLYTDTTLYQFNHRTQYVTIMPLDGEFTYEQIPMTARTRNDLARAVPLV